MRDFWIEICGLGFLDWDFWIEDLECEIFGLSDFWIGRFLEVDLMSDDKSVEMKLDSKKMKKAECQFLQQQGGARLVGVIVDRLLA